LNIARALPAGHWLQTASMPRLPGRPGVKHIRRETRVFSDPMGSENTLNLYFTAISSSEPMFTSLENALERFPITWNHVIDKESLKFKELEHVLIEKAGQLF
jgi:hypothetical protein